MKRILIIGSVCILLLCGCGQQAKDAPKQFTGSMPQQITNEDLRQRGAEIVSIGRSARELYGDFYGQPVLTEDDAFSAAASAADLLGIADFAEEIRLSNVMTSGTTCSYNFRQYYNGVPVVGTAISLLTDPQSGKIRRFQCGYVKDITVSTEPAVSASQAKKKAAEAYNVKITDAPELILIADSGVVLAWRMQTDSEAPSEITLDAQTGNVLDAEYPSDWQGGA